jgi:hypothetical protein
MFDALLIFQEHVETGKRQISPIKFTISKDGTVKTWKANNLTKGQQIDINW